MKHITCLIVALLSVAASIEAQQPKMIPRVGVLLPGSKTVYTTRVEAFRSGLRDLGYREGQSILTEWRFTEGKSDRLAEMAGDLVRSKMDVIVTSTTPVAQAVLRATRTTPIVMAASADPVGTGLIASLARPGGNVTGLSMLGPETDGRALELLEETIPKLTRVAFLWDPNNAGMASRLKALEAAGQTLRLQIQSVEVHGSKELDSILESVIANRADALLYRRGSRVFIESALSSLPARSGCRPSSMTQNRSKPVD